MNQNSNEAKNTEIQSLSNEELNDKLIDTVAAQVLEKYRRAFEELAK